MYLTWNRIRERLRAVMSRWPTDALLIVRYQDFTCTVSLYVVHICQTCGSLTLMLPLPADHFKWRSSPKFSKCKKLQNHCRIGKSPLSCKNWSVRTSERDCVLVIIRLMIAAISVISVWLMVANIWKSKASTTFYSSGENVYLVALLGMLRLPWRICYNRKKSKGCHKIFHQKKNG